jgi:hypothetical protein
MQEFYNAINQHAFNQQLGRGASNQMYEPSPGQYDPYTASRRPNYMPFGPNQQLYQPIYRPSYDQQVRTMDQMPQPMTPQPMQTQYNPIPMQQTQPRGSAFKKLFRGAGEALSGFGQGPSNYPYSVNYDAPMLSPQPMKSQYRPIPIASQTSIDQLVSQARSEGAADAAMQFANTGNYHGGGGAKAGGKVHGEGIDSLLKK